MLTIRLFRIGRKHQPSYKIVVTDKRNAAHEGRFVDEVGSWNPLTKQRALNADKIKEWMKKGAQPSNTIHNMLVEEKILKEEKVDVHKKSKNPAQPASGAGAPKPVEPAKEAAPDSIEAKPEQK